MYQIVIQGCYQEHRSGGKWVKIELTPVVVIFGYKANVDEKYNCALRSRRRLLYHSFQ